MYYSDYAYVGKLNDANAMVVVTSQGVIVIDTGNNQPETRNILKHIQAVTNQPVRYVVNTGAYAAFKPYGAIDTPALMSKLKSNFCFPSSG